MRRMVTALADFVSVNGGHAHSDGSPLKACGNGSMLTERCLEWATVFDKDAAASGRKIVCRSPPRDKSSTFGIGCGVAQPASYTGRFQRDEIAQETEDGCAPMRLD